MNHSSQLVLQRRSKVDVEIFCGLNEWQVLKCLHDHQVSKSTRVQFKTLSKKPKHPTIPRLPSEGSGLSPSDSLQAVGTRPHVSNVLFQSQTAWKQQNKLSVHKKTSHIHSTVVPSANSAAKQKNKQQLEGLRRLKVLMRAPLARLWRDLGGVCQSSSTRSQTYDLVRKRWMKTFNLC